VGLPVAMKSAAWCIPSAFVFGKKEKEAELKWKTGQPAVAAALARTRAWLATLRLSLQNLSRSGENVTLVYRTWVLQVVQ
jgi:hypothetical protein